MKILIINKFLYNRGGDCTYTFSLGSILKKDKHIVEYWGMQHPNNYSFSNTQFFPKYIDFEELNKNKSIKSGIAVVGRSIYSYNVKKVLHQYLIQYKPDIVHLNNIHSHLTPSIIDVIRNLGIPIVWTVHDYELICPNIHFISQAAICESCKKKKYYKPIVNRCKKNSLLASGITSIKAYIHRFLRIENKVNRFIVPSRFMYNKFIEYGWRRDNLMFIRNFLSEGHLCGVEKSDPENYVLYFGGLSPWKGINTLIKAMKELGDIPLVIMGGGHDEKKIKDQISSLSLTNISMIGRKSGVELFDIIARAKMVVLPSEWYENCPYSIMESLSLGVPVIASNIGGIPELVRSNYNGKLFKPGDSHDLSNKIKDIYFDDNTRKKYSDNCIEFAKREFSSSQYLIKINNLYSKLTAER